MKLYHYIMGKRVGVYEVEPGWTIAQIFEQTNKWPGTRFILIKG